MTLFLGFAVRTVAVDDPANIKATVVDKPRIVSYVLPQRRTAWNNALFYVKTLSASDILVDY